MRLAINVQAIFLNGRVELKRIEELICSRARENRGSVRRRAKLGLHPCPDLLRVPFEALSFRGTRGISVSAGFQLLAKKRLKVVPPVFVRLCVEIHAQHRHRRWWE